MASSDANAFSASDALTFHSVSVVDLRIVDTPPSTSPFTTPETLTFSGGSQSLVFDALALRTVSHNGGLRFDNGDSLVLGTPDDDASGNSLTAGGLAGRHALVLGFGGADSLGGSAASDTLDGGAGNDTIVGGSSAHEADYLFGGQDADSIIGGAGNDHIYGNSLNSVAGALDGKDTILAGAGMDYVNGNAGNDSIDGGDGPDRLYGGGGNDTVKGGPGDDYIQGNKGNDDLYGGGGRDTIHGGQDNDQLFADGRERSFLYGDAGDDTLFGDASSWLEGGSGRDQFNVTYASLTNLTSGLDAPNHGQVCTIGDYVDGEDQIELPLPCYTVLHPAPGLTFATPDEALTYANQLLAGSWLPNQSDVAAISVGSDTYLFFENFIQQNAINAVVRVVGVQDSVFDISDFPR